MQNVLFRNAFRDVAAGTTTYKLMTVINSGTDYVIYSNLNGSNINFYIILHDRYIAILKATKDSFPQIL